MIKEKIYKMKTYDGYENVKAIIKLGFDKDILTEHPSEFNDKMTELLFMFVVASILLANASDIKYIINHSSSSSSI